MIEWWCMVLVARNWRLEIISVSQDILLRGLCSGPFLAAGTYLMKLRSMLKLSNSVRLKDCLSL
jgi:hypothetical protein